MFKIETEYPIYPYQEGAMTAQTLEEFASTLTQPVTSDEDSTGNLAPTFSVGTAIAGVSWEIVRGIVGKFVWAWFDAHQNDTVVKFKIKLIVIPVSVTVKVKDCNWLIRALFGDRSSTAGTVTGGTSPNNLVIG